MEFRNNSSIAGNVNFVLGGMHDYNKVTTFPFKKIKKNIIESFSKGPIIVEDDVWIGFGSTVLSGVTLGQGSIIAAGSVVVKSTEPYSIYGGNPAKLIRYRFDTETIKGLLKLDFNVINQSEIDFKSLYSIPNSQNILALVSKINKNG
jgi:acetyltransferase-like isoleucine patch superfamily enzyme